MAGTGLALPSGALRPLKFYSLLVRSWVDRCSRIRTWFLIGLLAWLPGCVLAELPPSIAQALSQAGIPESHVGIVVQEMDNPAPLLVHGEQRSLNPASTMKLLITLSALDSLGPAHVFKTRVLMNGTLSEGILHGHLILQGGGDPALSLERFWLLLREIRARGVQEIRGDVLLDSHYYQLAPIDPAAFDQAPLRPYNAPPNALLVNDNRLQVRLRPDQDGIQARFDPVPVDGQLTLDNQLQTSDKPCHGWREAVKPTFEKGVLMLTGQFPQSCGEQSLWINLLPPEATVAALFAPLWQELGGRHVGQVRSGHTPEDARLLLEFDSPALALLVRDINKFSNNVMAKMLFLNLGAHHQALPATWEKGTRALISWLAGNGIEMPELVMENGSGLSRIERISAASLARLLRFAATRPAYFEFAASLPALGREGTLRNRMQDSSAAGMAWLKSGSLNNARNLAGYVLGKDGRRRILVMLINHENAPAAAPVQAALLDWTLSQAGVWTN